jgi:hypothetical protein
LHREQRIFADKANEGQIIYSSIFGYCCVISATVEKKYRLSRPGFDIDEYNADYCLNTLTIVDL